MSISTTLSTIAEYYYRSMLRRQWALKNLNVERLPFRKYFLRRCLSRPAKGVDEEDHREARTWLAKFNADTIPKNIGQFIFSRSSGPGGQNVNKYERRISSQGIPDF